MKINLKKWMHEFPADAIAVEIRGTARTAQKYFDDGCFNYWTPERIKGAFNFHNGTITDLKKYAENNKKLQTIIFLK